MVPRSQLREESDEQLSIMVNATQDHPDGTSKVIIDNEYGANIRIADPKAMITTLVQTDKPIYKPGEEGKGLSIARGTKG